MSSRAAATRSSRVARLTERGLGLGVLRFGLPLVVGMVLHTLFNLVDMFMIGRLEEATAALAALGICDMVAAIATILSNGVSTASVAIIARGAGAGRWTAVRRAVWQSMWLVTVLSLLFGLLGLFGSELLIRGVMQARGRAADLAIPYLQILLGGCFSIFLLLQVTSILRALGHAKTAAALLIGGNALNIGLNVILIYGPGPYPPALAFAQPIAEALGVPRFGMLGAAWATLAGRTVPVIIGAMVLARRRGGPRFHPVYLRPFRRELAQLLRLSWPSSAQFVLRIAVILVFISLVNAAYTTASDPSTLTAYSICLRLETLALFVGMGWGAAAASFVGTNLGAGHRRRAARAGWLAAAYALTCTVALTAVYLAYGDVIVAFFDDDPRVVRAGTEYLGTVGVTYGLLAAGVVLSQAMTGAGATLDSLALDATVLVGLTVPAAYLVAELWELPRDTFFQVIAGSNIAAVLAFGLYFWRGRFWGREA
jgi:putative MATE family efflux protein